MHAVLPVFIVLLTIVGCGDVTRLSDHRYPEKPSDFPIEVFYDQKPTRPYEEIAILRESSEWTTKGEKILRSLKQQAREVGADAIVLRGISSSQSSSGGMAVTNPTTGFTTFTSMDSTITSGQAIAIRYTDHGGEQAARALDRPQARAAVAVAPQPAQAEQASVVPVGFARWALAVNTQPQGALVSAYNARQELQEIGRTPFSTAWPKVDEVDVLVVTYQGRQVRLIPNRNQAVLVDFSSVPPRLTGGALAE